MKQTIFGRELVEAAPVDEATNTAITVEEGIDAVRLRPGMYVGGTDAFGLHHLFKEIIDNAVDEAMAGHCTQIDVVYGADGSLSVQDNGRGIPLSIDAKTGKPFSELIFTQLRWSGVVSAGAFKVRSGLNGVGASCVNVLSEWMEYEVRRESSVYRQHFERGVPCGPLTVVGTCGAAEHGTKVTWLADVSIFTHALDSEGNLLYDVNRLRERVRELAYLNKDISVSFHNTHGGKELEVYCYERGIADYVADLTATKAVLHSDVIFFSRREEGMEVEVALQFSSDTDDTVLCHANNLYLPFNGTPYTGLKQALKRSLSRYARKHGYIAGAFARFPEDHVRADSVALAALAFPNLSRTQQFSQDDIAGGLITIIAVRLSEPHYGGAIKERLTNPEVSDLVDRVAGEEIVKFLDKNPQVASTILAKVCKAAEARVAARKMR